MIPEPVSPTNEGSNFIAISRASIGDTSFSCINGVWICGNKEEINHSLYCTSHIWKFTLAINVLNIWSKTQTYFVGSFLIYFISVMHCDILFVDIAKDDTKVVLIQLAFAHHFSLSRYP